MLHLDFHHHTILVRSEEESLIEKLEDEFHFFVSKVISTAQTEIDLYLEAPPEMPPMVAVKILENAVVYRLASRQYIDYFGEALTIWDSYEKKVKIYSKNPERLYELAFLSIHSILGQELDRDGLCRVHGLAFTIQQTNALVMLPSKGGKSTLLTNILDNPEVMIISDDMPLCDKEGRLYPFPSKISLAEVPTTGALSRLSWHEFKRHHYPTKWTASLAQLRDRIILHPEQNKNLVIAGFRLSSGQTMLTQVPKWKMIGPMMEHMIMGFGLPQILEMFLKFNFSDMLKLIHHAFIRSICAFNLVMRSKCYHFYMGPDKSYNAQMLLDLVYAEDHT